MPKTTETLITEADRDGTILEKIKDPYTHVSIHTGDDVVKDLERLFSEKKTAQSRFVTDPDDPDATADERAEMFIQESLLYHANQISKWLKTAGNGEKQAFTAPFSSEDYGPVGCGIVTDYKDNSIREYSTNTMCTVLRKSESAPLGFTLVTAYPDMSNDYIKPTMRDLSADIQKTEKYKQADTVGKTYLKYITNPLNQGLATYRQGSTPDDSMMMIHVQTGHPNRHHEIKVKEDDITMKTVSSEPDEYGFTSKRTVQTPYTRQYAKARGLDYVKRVSLTDDAMFRRLKTEYPVISNQLSGIRNNIKASHPAPAKRPERTKPKPDYAKRAEAAFGHIKDKTEVPETALEK